jgi:hypothetical protein
LITRALSPTVFVRALGRDLGKEVIAKISADHENAVSRCLAATTVADAQDWLNKAKRIRTIGH